MAIITASHYRANVPSTPAWATDVVLTEAIDAAQKRIESYCGRTFDTATFTEYHDGKGMPCIQVKAPPITSITSITIYHDATSTTAYDSASEINANFRYDTDANGGVICWIGAAAGHLAWNSWSDLPQSRFGISPNFPRGYRNVVVVYVGGYATASMPSHLQQVCRTLVARGLAAAGNGGNLQSENIGGYGYTLMAAAELEEQDRALLGPFVLGRALVG